MSAATSANGSVTSAIDYVRSLSDEDKGHVLIALLCELIAINGGGKGSIPLSTPEGYFVPPLAADAEAEAVLPKLSLEWEKELANRLTRLHTAIPISQAITELKLPILSVEDEERTRRSLATPSDTFDVNQFLDDLSQKDQT